ncbi:MAG: hypothetical protein AB7P17_13180 [Nitrospirales bacterium]|nr:hypothetical protein [Nitrospirales bacterium]
MSCWEKLGNRQSQERHDIMYRRTTQYGSNKILLFVSLSLMMWAGMPSNANAMLVAGNVVSDREFGPQPDFADENIFRLRMPQRWGQKLFDVPLLKQEPPNNALQWKHGPNLSLKDPGRLPGIELGVEMHSFQALQSIIPEENFPKGLHHNHDRPLQLPPPVNAPDYNGGFLRFTW